jgi:hypothetical protein
MLFNNFVHCLVLVLHCKSLILHNKNWKKIISHILYKWDIVKIQRITWLDMEGNDTNSSYSVPIITTNLNLYSCVLFLKTRKSFSSQCHMLRIPTVHIPCVCQNHVGRKERYQWKLLLDDNIKIVRTFVYLYPSFYLYIVMRNNHAYENWINWFYSSPSLLATRFNQHSFPYPWWVLYLHPYLTRRIELVYVDHPSC